MYLNNFQSVDEREMHCTQKHGVKFGDIVPHLGYLEERMTILESRK
jgi:hypothetical protein